MVTVAIRDTYLLLWIIGTAVALYLGWRLSRKRGLYLTSLASVFTLTAAVMIHTVAMRGVTRIGIIPTEGDTAVCVQYHGYTALICAPERVGTLYDIRTQLRLDGIRRVDMLIVPHGEDSALTALTVILEDYLDGACAVYGEKVAGLSSFFEKAEPLTPSVRQLRDHTTVAGQGSFLWLEAGQTRLLICTGGDSVRTLPSEFRMADAIIYGGQLPSDTQLLSGTLGVVQGQRQSMPGAAACGVERLLIAQGSNDVVLMTRGVGDVDS
jgi:hypothetical protein